MPPRSEPRAWTNPSSRTVASRDNAIQAIFIAWMRLATSKLGRMFLRLCLFNPNRKANCKQVSLKDSFGSTHEREMMASKQTNAVRNPTRLPSVE